MIAIEKLRAICQQMPEYPHTGNKKPRASDFYDIYQVLTTCGIDLGTDENQALIRHIFGAKEVPLGLLGKISRERHFHRQEWRAVIDSTSGTLQEFDFYFDFVLNELARLKPLWVE
jgi:hypothetical protein